MKKLQSLAFYALVTPVMTLGAGSVLAQPESDHEGDREERSTQRDLDASQSDRSTTQSEPSTRRGGESDSPAVAGDRNTGQQSGMEHRGYMASAPANGIHASDIIGADVSTMGDEDLGSVSELIIDENGQIVAIVVGVGGFLGLGQKDVAIGWDDVMKSGDSDDLELQIDATREALRDAPEFEEQD